MTDKWQKALNNSEIFQNHLTSELLEEEFEKVSGRSSMPPISDGPDELRIFLGWMSITTLRKKVSDQARELDRISQESKELEEQVEEMRKLFTEEKAETADYIREMTENQYSAYQKLLEVRAGEKTQTEAAEELDIDDAALSRYKKDFKQNNIL